MRRLSLTEISPGSAAAVVGLPPSYVSGYGAIGERSQWDLAPLASEYNRNRWSGDHPPGPPINHFEWAIMQTYRVTNDEYGLAGQGPAANVPEAIRLKILEKNEAVVTALRDSKIPRYLNNYQTCLKLKSSTGAMEKWKYGHVCSDWSYVIADAQAKLANAITEAAPYQGVEERGSTAASSQAEVVSSQRDDILHSVEIAKNVVSDPDCNWWCQAVAKNPWLRWLPVGAVALVTARVLLPPLYGTWLARPERATAPPLDPFKEPEI